MTPDGSPRTGTFSGRKFLSKGQSSYARPKSAIAFASAAASASQQQSTTSIRSYSSAAKARLKHTNLAELERVLEADTATVHNARREMDQSQQNEINRANKSLFAIKRESDLIFAKNNSKEKEYFHLLDEIKSYEEKINEFKQFDGHTNDILDKISIEHKKMTENIDAENRTKKMLTLMSTRMEKELDTLRAEIEDRLLFRESTEQDCKSSDQALLRIKQELIGEEKLLDILVKTRKTRLAERKKKIAELKRLVASGEMSASKIYQNFSMDSNR
eukprot:gene11723-24585_t